MDAPEVLSLPTAAEDEARAEPHLKSLAHLIGALAASGGLVSPRRLEVTMAVTQSIGDVLGKPSLTRVLCLRALSSPPSPSTVLVQVKTDSGSLKPPVRVAIMRSLAELLGDDAPPSVAELAPDVAAALDVPLPDNLRRDEASLGETLGNFAERAMRLVRSEPPIINAAREFATELGERQLLATVAEAQKTGETGTLVSMLTRTVDEVRKRVEALIDAAEANKNAIVMSHELDVVADKLQRIAQQRYATITRRAVMLKRHLKEDLEALAEDAAEEFEADFRRLAEAKGWFGRNDTGDLNDRLVVKNLDRRYRQLARRYGDQLDLLDREVSDYCEEFTRVSDEALRPMARHEFRAIAPNPTLELRVKAAVDRASTRTLVAGAAGVLASGAAVQSGLIATAVVTGPVGIAVLGAVALAAVWKTFAVPGERKRRDFRKRARELEDRLREEVMTNLPRFESAVDAVVGRFRAAAVPDISVPRLEAERLREIADSHRALAQSVADAANTRIKRVLSLLGQVAQEAAING